MYEWLSMLCTIIEINWNIFNHILKKVLIYFSGKVAKNEDSYKQFGIRCQQIREDIDKYNRFLKCRLLENKCHRFYMDWNYMVLAWIPLKININLWTLLGYYAINILFQVI